MKIEHRLIEHVFWRIDREQKRLRQYRSRDKHDDTAYDREAYGCMYYRGYTVFIAFSYQPCDYDIRAECETGKNAYKKTYDRGICTYGCKCGASRKVAGYSNIGSIKKLSEYSAGCKRKSKNKHTLSERSVQHIDLMG